MNSLFKFMRNILIKVKVYFSRTASYISMINTAMILFLFLSNLEKYNVDIDIRQWGILIFICGVSLMIIFGFLEDKLGFYSHEQKVTQSRSPYFKEIVDRLDRIEKKINKK